VLTDEVLGAVVELVRPGRHPGGHGRAWEILSLHRAFLVEKLDPIRPHAHHVSRDLVAALD
jgi:hypothetical protein